MVNCTPESPVEIQTPTHCSLIGRTTARRVCYRPAIFFRHIRVFAFSFLKEKFGALLKKYYSDFFTFWKL